VQGFCNTGGTGENLFSMQDSRNLIRYGGMRKEQDFLQMDPALSYGLVEYLGTLEMLEKVVGHPGVAFHTAVPDGPAHCGGPRTGRQ
jgi:hypothetical protein